MTVASFCRLDMDEAMKAAIAVIACSAFMLAIVSLAMLPLQIGIG
jgi:hypothetical protein